MAPLIHPRRKQRVDVVNKSITLKKQQAKVATLFPNTDPRHVLEIRPGTYIYKSGLKSTWVKVRGPVMVAVAIVAAVYLGPLIAAKIQAMAAASAGGAGGAAAGAGGAAAGAGGAAAGAGGTVATGSAVAGKAAFASKVFTGAKTLTNYVNQGRTVKAIIDGKTPPPPIGVSGNNFTEWAMAEAKKQIGKKLTEKEEQEIRREIQAMQQQLVAIIPANTPMQPSPEIRPEIQAIMVKEKENSEQLNKALMIGVPIALLAFAI
jgi:hypothetical protein